MIDVIQQRARKVGFIPVLILLVVAGCQIYLARTSLLLPWKGGGFGMFSTNDGNMNRWIRVFVTGPNVSEELMLKGKLEDLTMRVQMFPSDVMLKKLARAVLKDRTVQKMGVDQVDIDVWRLEFENPDLHPKARIIRRFSYRVEGP